MAKTLIISCDGGGIRGLIPALVLQQLNRASGIANFLTGGKVGLYAGTSAGSFIALGLAAGTSIDHIVSAFQNDGGTIFQPTLTSAAPAPAVLPSKPPVRPAGVGSWWDTLWEALLKDVKDLLYTKYVNTGLRSVLLGLIPNNPTLSQVAPVVVTTFELSTSGGPWQPLVLGNLSGMAGGSVPVVDAALASGAAPTYFPPYQPSGFNYCADGGVAANNPAVVALAQAIRAGTSPSDIYLLSLGTGLNPDSIPIDTVTLIGTTLFGTLTWMFPEANPGGVTLPQYPLLTGLFDASSAMFDALARALLPSGQYVRINPALSQPIALDDYSSTAIAALTAAATNPRGSRRRSPSSTPLWVTDDRRGVRERPVPPIDKGSDRDQPPAEGRVPAVVMREFPPHEPQDGNSRLGLRGMTEMGTLIRGARSGGPAPRGNSGVCDRS